MIPAIKTFVHDLLWSEERFRLWARGFLLWAGMMAAQVSLTPTAEFVTWGFKAWAIRLLIAAAVGSAGFIKVGDKNVVSS